MLESSAVLFVWISLAISVGAVAVTGARAGRRGWATFKDSRRFTGALGKRLGALSQSTAKLERSASALESGSVKLQSSLAGLAASRRRLAVLTSALDEAQSTLGRLALFFPRK